jgi:hypothetical protein
MLRHAFKHVRASPGCHWATLKTSNLYARPKFPPNTVFIQPVPGGTAAPQMFLDEHGGYNITVSLTHTSCYTSFALALDVLYSFASTHPVDMVAVVPFGPPTPSTAHAMLAAWMQK